MEPPRIPMPQGPRLLRANLRLRIEQYTSALAQLPGDAAKVKSLSVALRNLAQAHAALAPPPSGVGGIVFELPDPDPFVPADARPVIEAVEAARRALSDGQPPTTVDSLLSTAIQLLGGHPEIRRAGA